MSGTTGARDAAQAPSAETGAESKRTPDPHTQRRIEFVYPLPNGGEMQHVRIPEPDGGKHFAYRYRRSSDEDWTWRKPEEADGLLYRPESLEAAETVDGVVWWTEGESDCDALRGDGLAAVSHHGGAGKATVAQAERLVGLTEVRIVADNDDAGATCALRREEVLHEAGFRGQITFWIPPKPLNDARDAVVAGRSLVYVERQVLQDRRDKSRKRPITQRTGSWPFGSPAEDFAEFVSAAKVQGLTWDDLDAVSTDVEWIEEPLIIRGHLVTFYSLAGAGKSLFMLDVACRKALAGCTVVYLDAENSVEDIRERIEALGYSRATHPHLLDHLHYQLFPPLDAINTKKGGGEFVEFVMASDPCLVVLDTQARFVDGEENSNDTHNTVAQYALKPLKARGVTVVILDHAGKDVDRGPRGGSAKTTYVDVVWKLTTVGDGLGAVLSFRHGKSRTHRYPKTVAFKRTGSPIRHESADLAAFREVQRRESAEAADPEMVERVAVWLAENGPAGVNAVRKGVRGDNNRIGNALAALGDSGRAKVQHEGTATVYEMT